jgi:hypothetical protein
MILDPDEAKRFFDLWLCMDAYVNRCAKVVAGVETPEQMRRCSAEEVSDIRKHLWARRELLADFVRENPFGLSPEELHDVEQFRHAVQGTFYVERCLKDYAVFVSAGGGDHRVYAVHGLTERVDDVLSRATGLGYAALVDTVLLPLRGRIVWDGLVGVQNMSFGPGIRRAFRDTYLRAKDRKEIIVSLDQGPRALPMPRQKTKIRNSLPSLDRIVREAETLGKPETTLQVAAFRLLKLSAQIARLGLVGSAQSPELAQCLPKAGRALKQVIEAVQRDRWE